MRVLIKNGRIVTAIDDYVGDILIERGIIAGIGQQLDVSADQVIDASARLVIPGGIDPHTHMDMPFGGTTSADDFYTGTVAAACGGTTTIVDYATQAPGESLLGALDLWHKKAAGKAVIDYGFHMIVRDLSGNQLQEITTLIDREGVSSFKLFLAYPGVLLVDDATLFKVMNTAGLAGGLTCVHAENGVVISEFVNRALAQGKTAPKYHALTRPTKTEGEGTSRAIAIAELAQAPVYIVHVSCADALAKIIAARNAGLPVWAETCPQYLFLDESLYDQPGFAGAKYVMTPPLRHKGNQEELWKGLAANHLQLVATDHCPFRLADQKQLGINDFTKIPNGAPGVEDRMGLVFNGGVRQGRISLNRFVEITSTAAARIFGLFPRKGTIAIGSDADIVIFNPNGKRTISASTQHMNVDYNCYEGMIVEGIPEIVLSRGEVVVSNGQFVGSAGHGNFLKRVGTQEPASKS